MCESNGIVCITYYLFKQGRAAARDAQQPSVPLQFRTQAFRSLDELVYFATFAHRAGNRKQN